MIGEHRTSWLYSKPLSEIARNNYSFIESSTGKLRIDVVRLLRFMKEEIKEESLPLNLRAIRLLPIERDEKWAIYEVALTSLFGEKEWVSSIGRSMVILKDDSQESLFFFLEELAAKTGQSFIAPKEEIILSLLLLIEKIDRSCEEKEEALEQLATLFSFLDQGQGRFLSLSHTMVEEELPSLLATTIALRHLKRVDHGFYTLVEAIVMLPKEERLPLAMRVISKLDLVPTPTLETILWLLIDEIKEERGSSVQLLDLPSLPSFLILEGEWEWDYYQIQALFHTLGSFSQEQAEEILALANGFASASSFSGKVYWLEFVSTEWEEKREIIIPFRTVFKQFSSDAVISLVKMMRGREKRAEFLQNISSLMGDLDEMGLSREYFLNLCCECSSETMERLLKESKPLFQKLDSKEVNGYRDRSLRILATMEEKTRREIIQRLQSILGEKGVSGLLFCFLLKLLQGYPLEEWQSVVDSAMLFAPALSSHNFFDLQEVVRTVQKIAPGKREELASYIFIFHDARILRLMNLREGGNCVRLVALLSSLKESDFPLEEGMVLLKACREPFLILDLLRHCPPLPGRKEMIQHLAKMMNHLAERKMGITISDRLLSHLLTMAPERRESFLTLVDGIFEKALERLSERAPSFIDQLMTALLLHREGESFLEFADHCLEFGLNPISHLFRDRALLEKAALNLSLRSEKGYIPEKMALKIANAIMGHQELLTEEHPLLTWAISTISICNPQAMGHPKNPHHLYAKLQLINANEEPIDLSEEKVPTFEVEIKATGERFSCRWNLQRMRHLAQEGGGHLDHDATSIPEGITHTTLGELYEPMRSRLQSIEGEIYQTSGLTLQQLQAFFDDPFIMSRSYHLNPDLPSGRGVPRDALQLSFILKRILDSSPIIPPDGSLSPREELLLTLASSVQNCSTGKSNSINDYYNALEPIYRQLVETNGVKSFLNDLLQRALHRLFTKDELLQRVAGDMRGGQDSHITRFLKNRLKNHLGLRTKLEFDPYTMALPDQLIALLDDPDKVQEALRACLELLSMEEFLHLSGAKSSEKLLQAIIAVDPKSAAAIKLLDELKASSTSFQNSLFAPKNFSESATMIAIGLGHTAKDGYALTPEENDRLFNLHEELAEEGIIPLTEEMIVRMCFATLITVNKK